MTIIHHPVLRVNADVPDEHVEILAESGWLEGHHPDSDFPDYPMTVKPPAPTATEIEADEQAALARAEIAAKSTKPPKPPKE